MLIVKKFGGSSVADAEKVRRVAGIIADDYSEGHDVVVVLSAQGDTTDDLIEKAKELNLDAIHDTVHEMARDEARHGKAFEGLLKRYFG